SVSLAKRSQSAMMLPAKNHRGHADGRRRKKRTARENGNRSDGEQMHFDEATGRVLGTQGWQQLLTCKKERLDAFDRARQHSRPQEVETYHGIVAEAQFRNWLSEFLPKKYGVTAGYVISQGASERDKLPAFDVIIYDQLESPVLWIESHPDVSPLGK